MKATGERAAEQAAVWQIQKELDGQILADRHSEMEMQPVIRADMYKKEQLWIQFPQNRFIIYINVSCSIMFTPLLCLL